MPGLLSDLFIDTPKRYWGQKLSGLLDAASTGAEAYAGATKPYTKEQAKTIGGLLADFTPVVGEVKSAYEGAQAAMQGNWPLAAMGAVGALPIVGTMARGVKAGKSVPNMFGQSGQIVWHGSPHKFDKFDMSKIGTGEGAQTYGHGLYMAESPDVARNYQQHGPNHVFNKSGANDPAKQISIIAQRLGIQQDEAEAIAKHAFNVSLGAREFGNLDRARKSLELEIINADNSVNKLLGLPTPDTAVLKNALGKIDELKRAGFEFNDGRNLYKADIPDEAVARFLDWDKKLSEQAPEIQPFLQPAIDWLSKMDGFTDSAKARFANKEATGKDIYNTLTGEISRNNGNAINRGIASEYFSSIGIPGIRYLDGVSRSAGQGSSNFVVFDPEMIRILDRNGVATGNQPWKPGEYNTLRGLLGP